MSVIHRPISYKMVIIPFEYVPHRATFRYRGEWWERVLNTTNGAEKYDQNSSVENNIQLIKENELVAVAKSKLERTIAHAAVVEEFDLCVKKKPRFL